MRPIRLESINESHMADVIDLLQDVSSFKPSTKSYGDIWRRFSEQTNAIGVVAISDQKICGYACLILEYNIRGGLRGHLEDVVIHTDFRGLGLGSLLLSEIERRAKEKNCYKVSLQCSSENQEFYSRNQYVNQHCSMQKIL